MIELTLNKFLKLFSILFCATLLIQCTETKRGCLDINSPNFDVDADEPCEDDCCEKTQLSVSFIHRYWVQDTLANTVSLGSKFNVFPDTNHFIEISKFHFYLTDFQMIKTDGTVLKSTSSTEIDSSPPITILDNNAFMDRSIVSAQNMGDFSPKIGIEKLEFNIGIDGIKNQIIPDSLENSHPFGWKNDSLNWDATDGFSYFRMDFLTYKNDSTLEDSTLKVIELTTPDVQPVEILANFDLQNGLNTRITLLINYNDLFEGVNIINDSEQTIKNMFLQNISTSIILDTINQE